MFWKNPTPSQNFPLDFPKVFVGPPEAIMTEDARKWEFLVLPIRTHVEPHT